VQRPFFGWMIMWKSNGTRRGWIDATLVGPQCPIAYVDVFKNAIEVH